MEKEDLKHLEQEKAELNTLINKGVQFNVKDVEFVRKKKWFGLRKYYERVEVTKTFSIQEPTLATLDRLSSEWIEIAIDDAKTQTADGMKYAREMVSNHAERCARIIAIASLGNQRLMPKPGSGKTVWVEDTAKLDDLTALFARTIKPSTLHYLCSLIATMCNLGDFLNSIRLMQTERTTMPIRVEENNVG